MNSNLNLAKEAAREAGSIIMKYYKKDYDIREKSYHNPVTTADKEADSFLKNTLRIFSISSTAISTKPPSLFALNLIRPIRMPLMVLIT